MYKGSCLCGSIRYEAKELNGPYVYCHCTSCRKASGSAYAANVSSPIDTFRVVSGERYSQSFESSTDKFRYFCSRCGSPLYTIVGKDPSVVRLRLGALDSTFTEPPAAHIFVSEKPGWHTISDTLPQFDLWPDSEAFTIPGSRQPTKKSTH